MLREEQQNTEVIFLSDSDDETLHPNVNVSDDETLHRNVIVSDVDIHKWDVTVTESMVNDQVLVIFLPLL
jgi:hypothetical protein